MKTIVQAICVVLGLPKGGVSALIIRLTVILDAFLANKATFPSPPIALAKVSADVAALTAAEAAIKTKAAGTKQTRDGARALVIADAKQLRDYVQQIANANPTEAQSIAEKAAMTLRKVGARSARDVTIKQGLSGTLHVSGRSVKGARAHEWEYSVDGGKSWTVWPATTRASTLITGLAPGSLVQVRHRIVVVKGAPQEWSAAFQAAVS